MGRRSVAQELGGTTCREPTGPAMPGVRRTPMAQTSFAAELAQSAIRRSHRPWWLRRPDPGPSRLAPTLGPWPCRRSPRRSCSGRSRSARPTACFTSTASRAGAWVPSQRASGGRRAGSAAGSSRSRTSSCRSTAVAASSERSPVRHSSARTTRSASTRTASRSGWSASRRCSGCTPRRSGTTARSSP